MRRDSSSCARSEWMALVRCANGTWRNYWKMSQNRMLLRWTNATVHSTLLYVCRLLSWTVPPPSTTASFDAPTFELSQHTPQQQLQRLDYLWSRWGEAACNAVVALKMFCLWQVLLLCHHQGTSHGDNTRIPRHRVLCNYSNQKWHFLLLKCLSG